MAATDQANYAAAFPNTAAGMGCPEGSNGDGSVTAADSAGGLYWNGGAGWTPIAGGSVAYTGEFQGRGDTISHRFISNGAADATVGLFGSIGQRGRVTGLGLEQVSIASSSYASVGSIAGINQGTITSSYAAVAGSARADGAIAQVGELTGHNLLVDSKSSYAMGTIADHGTTLIAKVGGLAGANEGTITASYVRGPITFSGSAAAGGGLVEANIGTGTATNSYGDTTASGLPASPVRNRAKQQWPAPPPATPASTPTEN